jgi:WD40 repeat protein
VIQTLVGHTNLVLRVIELDSGELASISRDETVKIWDRATSLIGNTINIQNRNYSPYTLVCLPNGNLVAAREKEPFDIEIFSPITGDVLQTLSGHTSDISGGI